ncbi:MAG: Crp/Fnr family transcriptional regulator [Thiohalocapsa sp.]
MKRGDVLLQQEMQQHEQRYRRGQLLVRMGERQGAIFRLAAGAAARFRVLPDGRRQIMCFLTPGDIIAARALMVERLPDSVETLSTATVHALDCAAALDLVAHNPDVALRLMWQIGEDERRLRNNTVMLAKGSAKERIAVMLLDILGRLAVAGGNRGTWQVVSLRQQDIADHLGLTLVHVNRTLKALREEGLIDVRIGAITIRDRVGLLAYAAPMLDVDELDAPEFSGAA